MNLEDVKFATPFHSIAVIKFRILSKGYVSLKIYNLLGQHIRTLIASELKPGLYERIWDGKNDDGRIMNSGLYIFKLKNGTLNETRRFFLPK